MNRLDPELVRDLVADLAAHFGSTILDKRTAAEIHLAARVLHPLGVLSADPFLHMYATSFGGRIYLPFEVGTPADGWGLWDQILSAAHECLHVLQSRELGPLRYAWRYFGRRGSRAPLEAEALRVQLELAFWRDGRLMTPRQLALSHRAYAATDADVDLAELVIATVGDSVARGEVMTQPGRYAIAWLDENAPELRVRH